MRELPREGGSHWGGLLELEYKYAKMTLRTWVLLKKRGRKVTFHA